MKYLSITIIVLIQLSNCLGQTNISCKVIAWKPLDNLDSLKIFLQTKDKEILKTTFHVDMFKYTKGEYPRTIFEVDLDEMTRNLEFNVSYKYKKEIRGTSDQFSHFEILYIPINNREERIELEIHFQKYYNEEFHVTSKESIDRLVAKKIYKLPEGIKLIRNWEPKELNTPKYIIQNNTSYKLYGDSGDGNFEGELFKITNDNIEQVYTGGYNLSNEPSKQLYRDNYVLSTIRDHRETNNKYKISENGNYIYRVFLAFLPYEVNNRFGKIPFFSVNKKDCGINEGKHKIYEYFELKDQFEIK